MAVIDKIQLPDGSQFDVKDSVSQYASQAYVQAQVAGVTKASIGLGNVDNTSDVNKPVSTAQQAAIDAVGEVNDFTITTTWSANADTGDYATFPYKQTIATQLFTHANDAGYKAPDWETLSGTPTDFMTQAEREDDMKLCTEANFTTSGITVLAKEATTNALTLRVRGLGQWQ